jgi:hypothetical protein
MHIRFQFSRALSVLAVPVLCCGIWPARAQVRPVAPTAPALPAQLNDKDVAATQAELIRLLRLSPTLTTVVSHDPSLLANQDYVAHNNPQLAAFLTAHPEVARNPDFYLFTHMHAEGEPDEALERAVWPDVYRERTRPSPFGDFLSNMPPVIAFAIFLAAVVWLTRFIVEHRRWQRIFKLQSEVHGRLIDKFSSNQELAGYMDTEAGKRFLEAAPIPLNAEPTQRVPNAVARVLTALQIGIVLVLLGSGFMMLRKAGAEMDTPMLVMGTICLMPGIGFILSAGITWLLAARLGLLPPPSQSNFDSPLGAARDRQ